MTTVRKLQHLIRVAEVSYHAARSRRHVARRNGWTRQRAKAQRAAQLASISVQPEAPRG